LRESVSVFNYMTPVQISDARGDTSTGSDHTSAIAAILDAFETVYLPDDCIFRVSTVGCIKPGRTLFSNGSGTLQATVGTQSTIYLAAGASNFTLDGVRLIGMKASTGYVATSSGVHVDTDAVTVQNCDISYFGFAGITLSTNNYSGLVLAGANIRNNKIHHNSSGIESSATFEYAVIDGNNIYENGWNNARTGWANSYLNAGYHGPMSNTAIINNTINSNACGVFVDAGGGANSDHNKIANNTINHNCSVGLYLRATRNWVQVIGNTVLSNVLTVPAVAFAPTGSAHDVVIEDVGLSLFMGNTFGPGSWADYLPIYGHGRNRYIGNNFLWCVPKEMRAPMAGTVLHDSYGYAGFNGDNLFSGNCYLHTIAQPVILGNSVNTVNKDNIENTASGGQHLVDGVINTVAPNSGWSVPAGYSPIKYWRTNGNVVHVSGTVLMGGSPASDAFTLPVGFRPTEMIDVALPTSGTWVCGVGRMYPAGGFQPVTLAGGSQVSFLFSFTL
jgi:hypothetical protein